ncbi:Membrane metallo-endopeptidase-like 1 isoform X2 [Aphelenchoides fujianensis]|nr:Membrane metallo-endopeptidase-like 1 isoform X2 [Aphelenchoides fujianensis]
MGSMISACFRQMYRPTRRTRLYLKPGRPQPTGAVEEAREEAREDAENTPPVAASPPKDVTPQLSGDEEPREKSGTPASLVIDEEPPESPKRAETSESFVTAEEPELPVARKPFSQPTAEEPEELDEEMADETAPAPVEAEVVEAAGEPTGSLPKTDEQKATDVLAAAATRLKNEPLAGRRFRLGASEFTGDELIRQLEAVVEQLSAESAEKSAEKPLQTQEKAEAEKRPAPVPPVVFADELPAAPDSPERPVEAPIAVELVEADSDLEIVAVVEPEPKGRKRRAPAPKKPPAAKKPKVATTKKTPKAKKTAPATRSGPTTRSRTTAGLVLKPDEQPPFDDENATPRARQSEEEKRLLLEAFSQDVRVVIPPEEQFGPDLEEFMRKRAERLAKQQQFVGVPFPLLDGEFEAADVAVGATLWGRAAAFFKRALDLDFLVAFRVLPVDKIGRDRDIFLRQTHTPLLPADLRPLLARLNVSVSEEAIRKLHLLDALLHPEPKKEATFEYEAFETAKEAGAFAFVHYFANLLSYAVVVEVDEKDLFFYVQDGRALRRRLDVDELRVHFAADGELEEVVCNDLHLVLLHHSDLRRLDCDAKAAELLPELAARVTSRRSLQRNFGRHEHEKTRAEIAARFNETTARIKAAFAPVVNSLSGVSDEAKARILSREALEATFAELRLDATAGFPQLLARASSFRLDRDFLEATRPTRPLAEKRGMPLRLPFDALAARPPASAPATVWFGRLGREIAAAVWRYASEAEAEVRRVLEADASCFFSLYGLQRREEVAAINVEVIVLKIAYGALLAYLLQHGNAANSSLRPEEAFFAAGRLHDCDARTEWAMRNTTELALAFHCAAQTTAAACPLVRFDAPFALPESKRSLNIPPAPVRSSPAIDRLSADIEYRLNVSVSPCENFDEYACSARPTSPFLQTHENNLEVIRRALERDVMEADTTPVVFLKKLHELCELSDQPFLRLFAAVQREWGAASFLELRTHRPRDQPPQLAVRFDRERNEKAAKREREERAAAWGALFSLGFGNSSDLEEVMASVDAFRAHLAATRTSEHAHKLANWRDWGVDWMADFLTPLFGHELLDGTYVRIDDSFWFLTQNDSTLPAGAANALAEDVLFHLLTVQKAPSCVEFVVEAGPLLVARLLVDRFPTRSARERFARPLREFEIPPIIEEVGWMSAESKLRALRKLDAMLNEVAFPPLLVDDETFERATAANEWDFRHPLKRAHRNNAFVTLRASVLDARRTFVVAEPAGVNAANMLNLNALLLPIGILNEPSYSPDYPLSVVFGRIGFIIAHELLHSLDPVGIHFDANGTLVRETILDKAARDHMQTVADCLEEQASCGRSFVQSSH